MAHKYLAMFRAVLVETLLLQTLYAPEASLDRRLVWALLLVYSGLAGLLYWLDSRDRLPQHWSILSFIGDILMTELILYASGVLERDFYLAYFLVILATCLLENPAFSFIVGGVSCIVYGTMAFPGWEGFDPAYLLRLSVLLATSFFSTYIIDRARALQRATAESYEAKMASMQRLSLFGQALAGVLHEVKTPLGTIALTAEYVREVLKRGRPEEAAERLAVIEHEAERAAGIITEHLDFARPSELKLEPLDVSEVLRKALEVMRVRLDEREIALETDIEPGLRARGSRRHLMQVFTILIMNAADAMPLGGKLTVSCQGRDGGIVARLRDTGRGLSPEAERGLFEPFASRREGGTGLGLSIARWIMEKHGGSVALTGAADGAEAVVRLPPAAES